MCMERASNPLVPYLALTQPLGGEKDCPGL